MNWKILHKKSPADTSELIERLLQNRKLSTKEEQDAFLNPKDPIDLSADDVGIDKKSLKKALERIKEAIDKNEQIVVFGDYDCDGICSTAILWRALFDHKAKVLPFIPDRTLEGYGLSPQALDHVAKVIKDVKLIITVDNGIVAVEQTEYAKKLGFDVIISDHHTFGEKIPQALAIIHTTSLAGSGISWFLAREVRREFGEEKIKDLDLAAFGTIADMVPLIGPNRSIAKYGLIEFNQTKKIGLKSLINDCSLQLGKIGSYEISFALAPRINALGRIDNALDALRLLCTSDFKKASDLSLRLCAINTERQKLTEETVLHAREYISINKKETAKLLFVANEAYNQGVIGLVAGKLVEEFYRPSIVISKGEKFSKASARSISGFNIIEAIRTHTDLIVEAGGHPMAAGFTVETKNLDLLEEALLKFAHSQISDEMLVKELKIDSFVDLNLMTNDFWEKLQQFLPFGMSNFEPIFSSEVEVVSVKIVGNKGQHLQLKVQPVNSTGPLTPIFPCIAFNQSFLAAKLTPGLKIEIAFQIAKDEWNGVGKLQFKIKDLKMK